MLDPFRINQVQDNGTLRLTWDNRTAPKQRGLFVFLFIFWLFWAPLTVYMTVVFFRGDLELWFGLLFFVLGWLATLGIPFSFVSRWWSESLSIAPGGITYGCQGLLAPWPRTYPIHPQGKNPELAFGYMPCHSYKDEGSDTETMITLSLYGPKRLWFRRRHLIAYWLAPAVKAQIFNQVEAFVTAHHIPLAVKRYGIT
jgi:hypothetical protein